MTADKPASYYNQHVHRPPFAAADVSNMLTVFSVGPQKDSAGLLQENAVRRILKSESIHWKKPSNVSPDNCMWSNARMLPYHFASKDSIKQAKGDATWLNGKYTKHMSPKELQNKDGSNCMHVGEIS